MRKRERPAPTWPRETCKRGQTCGGVSSSSEIVMHVDLTEPGDIASVQGRVVRAAGVTGSTECGDDAPKVMPVVLRLHRNTSWGNHQVE
jgi:hypothetical protein